MFRMFKILAEDNLQSDPKRKKRKRFTTRISKVKESDVNRVKWSIDFNEKTCKTNHNGNLKLPLPSFIPIEDELAGLSLSLPYYSSSSSSLLEKKKSFPSTPLFLHHLRPSRLSTIQSFSAYTSLADHHQDCAKPIGLFFCWVWYMAKEPLVWHENARRGKCCKNERQEKIWNGFRKYMLLDRGNLLCLREGAGNVSSGSRCWTAVIYFFWGWRFWIKSTWSILILGTKNILILGTKKIQQAFLVPQTKF